MIQFLLNDHLWTGFITGVVLVMIVGRILEQRESGSSTGSSSVRDPRVFMNEGSD